MLKHVFFILAWFFIIIVLKDILFITDIAFIVGLISLLIVAIIHLTNSELFYLFFKGFRIIWEWVTPENRGMKRTEEMVKQDYSLQRFKKSFHQTVQKLLIWTGVYSIAISIFLSILQAYN
ncbi:DUF3899 domain-containing protein [Agaribacter marinus]|uniref:DUF3899 domain-containing protein n=1 Tax=Virgibacillus salarius TaxID=447199 RepID=A0A941DXD3_9BACI|nr:DUF3899 domain-containing protein [Virgibacillus salarius]MBR7797257.1 DUF3899 domain-containing protein [Virgibacillus salarius]NAZ09967.1 DUF3899 domain-containing protein [Agaribacter marinus]